jgi:hypothetical protein
MSEHRRFTRIPFISQATLETRGQSFAVEVHDLSLKGALLQRPNGWQGQIGGVVVARIVLQDDSNIEMEGEIAHLETDRVGIRCEHLDIDSATHLRRLVELNLGNAAQLERELHAMIRAEA